MIENIMSRKPKPVEDDTGDDADERRSILVNIDPVARDDAVAEDEAFKYIEEHQK
jgi:hypothetical protein